MIRRYTAVRTLIKNTRYSLGMSQEQFAHYINSKLPTVQRWESGTAAPGGLMTARLIEVGIPVKDLVDAFEADSKVK